METSTFSRRSFLKAAGALSVGGVLAACTPPQPDASDDGQAAADTQNLIVWWGGWTPTESMERSEDNPNPHNKILEVVDDYQAEHPDVRIEWIRLPAGVDSREWMVAQQTAGTIPHVMPAAQWIIKEDVDKDWWVNLSPFLDEPNPYIPAGAEGSDRWIDQFYPTPNTMLLIEGNRYNVAFGINTTWFYYNVDLYDELGISVPQSYAEFLENCQVAQDAGLIGYDHMTFSPSDTDAWYRQQIGSMIMERDLAPLVNPDGEFAELSEVACAIRSGEYSAHIPQFRQWLELWKLNVPYRRADWTVQRPNATQLFLTKKTPGLEAGSWIIPQLEIDPLMDFEWATFWAPPLTKESSEFVTDPPSVAPNVGTVTNNYAVSTRARKDGVLDTAIDLLRFMSHPENVGKVQGEIGTDMPNVKNVNVPNRFAEAHKGVVQSLGYVTMFQYEIVTMDLEAAERCGKAWWAYLLDEMTIDECIEENQAAFEGYAARYIDEQGNACA
ncbi:ABC transporter substrate-binding protein [Chloroflexi bacterium TSY]|nr:ABC transporter substrate-binding protein [Chloroflexi bacterium TSY]